MDGGSLHYTGGGDQNHPQEKEMQEGKVVVWGGFTNIWGQKRLITVSSFWYYKSIFTMSEMR